MIAMDVQGDDYVAGNPMTSPSHVTERQPMTAKDDQRVEMTNRQVRDQSTPFVVELPPGPPRDHVAAESSLIPGGDIGLDDWKTDNGRTLR